MNKSIQKSSSVSIKEGKQNKKGPQNETCQNYHNKRQKASDPIDEEVEHTGNQVLMKIRRVADEDAHKALLQPERSHYQRSHNLTDVPFIRVGASVKKLVEGKWHEELVELQDNKIHCGHCYAELMSFKNLNYLNIDRIEGRLKHYWDDQCDDPEAQQNSEKSN